MKIWRAYERNTKFQPLQSHEIEIPDYGEPDFYRAIRSVQAFRHRENARAYPVAKDGSWSVFAPAVDSWFDIRTPGDIEMQEFKETIAPGINAEEHALPVQRHKTVWEFYLAIGYDYKKKRFNRNPVGVPAQDACDPGPDIAQRPE